MTTNRRQFLVGCSTLTVAASLTPAAVLASPLRTRSVSLERISVEKFAACRGANFRVLRAGSIAAGLRLLEVTPWQQVYPQMTGAEDSQNEKFSLVFLAVNGPALAQDTYLFEHSGIGQFAMFIVPIGTMDTSHDYYEAVFNRPREGRAPS
jgi:hypothetical protein